MMERFHLDAVQAFTVLSRLSQEENTKLHDVAEDRRRRVHPADGLTTK